MAVSKLPWLTALHAMPTCGTWTRGYYFAEERGGGKTNDFELPIPCGLRATPAFQFAVERRRGWSEAADSPPRAADDTWDERRNARMQKRRPGGGPLLCVESLGWAGGEFGVDQAVDGLRVRYWLETNEDIQPLDHLQWADWDRDGHLLAATRDGKLQLWHLAGDIDLLVEEDISLLEPDPSPAPEWARRW